MLRKISFRWFMVLLIVSTAFSFQVPMQTAAAESGEVPELSNQQLIDNDYILYFVNAGDKTPATLEGNDKMGLYASVTEQVYGADPITGKSWGLTTSTTGTNVPDATTKTGSLRYYNGTQVRSKAISYMFELPTDKYDITYGFYNPWSSRNMILLAEGRNVAGGDYDSGTQQLKEFTTRGLAVMDGMLNVSIAGPSTGTLTNYNDPLINYIIVRKSVILEFSDLQGLIDRAKGLSEQPEYTVYSVNKLKAVIETVQNFINIAKAQGTDVSTLQNELHSYKLTLNDAIAALATYVANSAFTPGAVWMDTNGAPIQAHGGGILYDQASATYYWYGEDKTLGYMPTRGVRVYSSKDLYNWEDEGLALTAIESMGQFDTDPLISGLYAGRTDKADIFNDIGTMRVLERPKVIYNDVTGKYVMWLHTDGPSTTSTANYAKAEAGYALSDSPTGPFVYGKSERMDRVPAGATYNGQPNQPGMARDMNLFKDDDGTAYLIYSSEENMTMYISKLNESYTDVTGWHKDGNEQRDTTYKSQYGVDYIRVFPGAQREAPAMFKYQGKYYMITSGATGWAPNAARYTVADQIFGEWRAMRDPSVGTKASTTFDSQSTNIITLDAANGKYIFMGDRWKSSDLADSRYIWLPVEFGQDDQIILKWYDQWNLSLLNRMGRITINTTLPKYVPMGRTPILPDELSVTRSNNVTEQMPVSWTLNANQFSKPGRVTVNGNLPLLENKEIAITLDVLPEHAVYFVNAGGAVTADYSAWTGYMGESLLNKGVPDQQYNPLLGQNWGYVGDSTNTSGSASDDLFTNLRYLKANSGNDITYKFDVSGGVYSIYTGLYDPWAQYSNGGRKADIIVNGQTITSAYVFSSAKDVLAYPNVVVNEDGIYLTVHRSASAAASSSDPQISWLIIVKEPSAQEVADSLTTIAAPVMDAVSLNLPAVPVGYSLAIKQSSNPGVIGLDGVIIPPDASTTVELILEVTRDFDGSKGILTINVTVPARSASAQEVANTLTEMATPAKDDVKITLPEVPTGYTVTIKETGNSSVVQMDGTILAPSKLTRVELTLEVTRISDHTKGTVKLTVKVQKRHEDKSKS
ncbi:glycoside hydrolase family 43 protein [Paenibacillus wynnii]|uniref:glycoside hydrolase family 43 protein n=1 Tax=Paenibacillus wynnii TaxID=268407 RepID=UPI00068F3BE0|nr:glycoside hydrolase family 43 protein [Paenibacillus wynnii]